MPAGLVWIEKQREREREERFESARGEKAKLQLTKPNSPVATNVRAAVVLLCSLAVGGELQKRRQYRAGIAIQLPWPSNQHTTAT